jgi:hypothetical protein
LFWQFTRITLQPGEEGPPDYTKSANYIFIVYGLIYSVICGFYCLRAMHELGSRPTHHQTPALAPRAG